MTTIPSVIKIGTRGSPLALCQTHMVQGAFLQNFPDLDIEIIVIKTSGDWNPADGEVPLNAQQGGKGQFAKEIEEALLSGAIDIAVHSMKDMDSNLPEGLTIDHMLPRQDPRDALLLGPRLKTHAGPYSLDDLPLKAVVGTMSVRRAAFLLRKRPDLHIVPFRGNVQTRIDKLHAGQVDATLLALAGLNRLGLVHHADIALEAEDMLPSAGQGAVGIEMRAGETGIAALLEPLSCLNTVVCVRAERAVLRLLDGSCRTPIGAYALWKNKALHIRAEVISRDGTQRFFDEIQAENIHNVAQAVALAEVLGKRLQKTLPPDILT